MTAAFRELLAGAGRALIGTFVKFPTPLSVDLLALAGLDFVVIDMEHAPLDVSVVHELIGAARGRRLPALVRVPDHTPSTIARVLDSGAAGVVVPHVDDVDQARAVIAAARFPPHGTRGFGPTVRAGDWGRDARGYRASGEDCVVILQLESRAAVEAAADMAAVDGVGGLFVGPVDLVVETGLDRDSAEFAALLATADAAAEQHGIPIGAAVGGDPAAVRDRAGRHAFVVAGNDASLLCAAGAALIDAVLAP